MDSVYFCVRYTTDVLWKQPARPEPAAPRQGPAHGAIAVASQGRARLHRAADASPTGRCRSSIVEFGVDGLELGVRADSGRTATSTTRSKGQPQGEGLRQTQGQRSLQLRIRVVRQEIQEVKRKSVWFFFLTRPMITMAPETKSISISRHQNNIALNFRSPRVIKLSVVHVVSPAFRNVVSDDPLVWLKWNGWLIQVGIKNSPLKIDRAIVFNQPERVWICDELISVSTLKIDRAIEFNQCDRVRMRDDLVSIYTITVNWPTVHSLSYQRWSQISVVEDSIASYWQTSEPVFLAFVREMGWPRVFLACLAFSTAVAGGQAANGVNGKHLRVGYIEVGWPARWYDSENFMQYHNGWQFPGVIEERRENATHVTHHGAASDLLKHLSDTMNFTQVSIFNRRDLKLIEHRSRQDNLCEISGSRTWCVRRTWRTTCLGGEIWSSHHGNCFD